MRFAAIAIAVQLSAVGTSLAQQASPSLYAGSRLRVTVTGRDRVVGTLFRSDAQSVVVRHDGDTVRVAWEAVERLEIARATRRSSALRTGATIGGVIGLVLGGATFAICDGPHHGWTYNSGSSCCGVAIPIGALAGLAVGSAVGGAIQLASRGGGWKDVPLHQVRVSAAPTPRGVGLGASIAF